MILMDMKVESEKENPFFKRKELVLELSHASSATPSKADLAKDLAAKYKVDESQVVVEEEREIAPIGPPAQRFSRLSDAGSRPSAGRRARLGPARPHPPAW
jgi:hypothetical protein